MVINNTGVGTAVAFIIIAFAIIVWVEYIHPFMVSMWRRDYMEKKLSDKAKEKKRIPKEENEKLT